MSRYNRAMADISIPAPAQPLPAYFAAPSGNRRWPGVVVIHDIFGMDEDPRRHVDWFAKAGYLAVAPNLFFWGRRMVFCATDFCTIDFLTNSVNQQ